MIPICVVFLPRHTLLTSYLFSHTSTSDHGHDDDDGGGADDHEDDVEEDGAGEVDDDASGTGAGHQYGNVRWFDALFSVKLWQQHCIAYHH